MTASLYLELKKREKSSKIRQVAPPGSIPGVLYGKGIDNFLFWVDRRLFNSLYENIGESTIFKARIGEDEERNVLVKEVQRDILDGKPIHVDLYQVRMDEEIEATVELYFLGESPAVKELGGVLVKNINEIEVRCLPADLPSKIEVDVSQIKNFDDYIYIKDLSISEKIEILIDPETVVAMVAPPRSDEELAELETEVKEDVAQVEGIIKEEKAEEASEKEKKPVAEEETE